MSEGNGASNGTSAPTAPAPGVATPTPTPKSGEGAVTTPPAVQTKPSFTPLKVTLPARGQFPEEVVELTDEDALRNYVLKGKGYDRAHKENLEKDKRWNALQSALSGPQKLQALKVLGLDMDAEVEAFAREKLRRMEMSEADRKAEDEGRNAATAKQRADAAEAELARLREERQADLEWREIEPALLAAAKEQGLTLSERFNKDFLSPAAADLLELGIKDPALWLKEARKREAEEFDSRLSALEPSAFVKRAAQVMSKVPAEQLLALIPEDTLKTLFRLKSAQLRGAKPAAHAPAAQPKKEAEYIDAFEARKRLGV